MESPPPTAPDTGTGTGTPRSWALPFVAGAVVVALVASSITAVVQWRQASAAEDEVAELRAEVTELRAEVARLEEELEAAQAGGLEDLLGGLLGEDAGAVADLLGDLLGDDVDGLLDDFLGDDLGGFDLDGLGDLLGGTSGGVPGAACFMPDAGDGFGDLFDLFGQESLPDDPEELVDVIADHVAEMRELEWDEEVEVEFLDDDAVIARIEELLEEDADPQRDEITGRLLATLGAIPPDTDFGQLQRDLLTDAVAGFYVPETGEIVVRVPEDGRIRPVDRVTLAHELEHALADQALGLPDTEELDWDASLAALGVIEGDATLLMNFWALEHLSMGDQLGMAFDADLVAQQAMLDEVPDFLRQELLFPYTDGLEYACQLYLDDGWSAIDAAYHDDRPTTSAQILQPGRDLDGPATPTDLADPPGYTHARTDTFGMAPLTWLFQAPGGDEDAALSEPFQRASSWAGGQVQVWLDGEATAVGVALVDGGDGPPLCGSVTDWYGAAFPDATESSGEAGTVVFAGGDTEAVVACDGADVQVGIGPDLATATAIVTTG